MLIQSALIISVILQFIAFIISISLIPKTKYNIAWISISTAFMLMAMRRLADLIIIFKSGSDNLQSLANSWIAVIISVAMLIASVYIRRILLELNKLNKMQKENESKVLSAIISTEEKERRYFSRELHDGLAPLLSSIKMSLTAISPKNEPEHKHEIIRKALFATDSAIVTTKEISNHLNPQILERYGLLKAIQTFANNSLAGQKLKFSLYDELKNERCNYNTEVILYRIFCELLNNTLKHSGAEKASASLFASIKHIVLIYEDNGKGFDMKQRKDMGLGLPNIISRVKSLNGSSTIESSPGKGIYVHIELPR